ncbi:MAG: threonine/serine dehydratase [Anaerolineales bacterium]|nr:threonine/serine dehydratase [Chloroflexota bacterium]MBL6982286.1 threonine/serine dehydratase [Anaerolineales bacterium]
MIPKEWIDQAHERIAPYIRRTPLTNDSQNDLYIKWENRQVTGSFKGRGAFNKILKLEDWEREQGLLAASAGNHGQGVALAGKVVGAPVTIYAPDHAPEVKVRGMQELGAEVRLIPGGYDAAENAAIEQAENSNATWVSPYNDGDVIAGQATSALEALEQLEEYPGFEIEDSIWLVPVSGGGLVAGIGAVLKGLPKPPKLIAVQAKAEPFMHALFYHGHQNIQAQSRTIADGLSGSVEEGSITIPLIRKYVDEIFLVDEAEIANAVSTAWHQYGERIEAAGAVVLAAALSGAVPNRPVVLVVSGGNIQPEAHQEFIK